MSCGGVMPFEAGQLLGDYEILNTLGSGGMGQVYRVRNVISKRVEAIKALLPDMTADPDFAARFAAEIRTLASFDHPNIAQLRTAFQVGSQQFMVMEFVEGSTLDRLTANGPLPQAEVLDILKQVLSALSYAHARGVIHRDIKPSNVMLTGGGVVKLMDFGIAKSASEHKLTQPGSTVGSLSYMSPEQVRGEIVDARSDVYSAGILLYELLSGQRPFRATTTYALLNQHLNEAPQPLLELDPRLSPGMNDVVLTAIAKDPAARFQTAAAFSSALNSVAAPPVASQPLPHSAPDKRVIPIRPPAAAGQNGNRGAWVLAGAMVAILALVGLATVAPHFFRTAAKSRVNIPNTARVDHQSQSAPARQAEPAAATGSAAPPAPAPSEAAQQRPRPDTRPAARQAAPAPSSAAPTPVSPPEQPAAAPPSPVQPPPNDVVPAEEDLTPIQDELAQLNSRAAVVNASLERLQQQQAADGLGLRQDIAASSSRMNSYLHAVDNDIANRNMAAAHRHMDMAEKEVSTLEKFFNK